MGSKVLLLIWKSDNPHVDNRESTVSYDKPKQKIESI
jgi:hypothetical protein